MESPWLVWVIIYLVFALLIYIGYAVALNSYNYPNKKERSDVLWIIILTSAITFVLSGMLVAADLPTASAGMLFVSMIMDFISAGIIGTVSLDDAGAIQVNRGLAYISLSPMAYKMLLFGYIAYLGGFEGCGGKEALARAPGRAQFESASSKFSKKTD